jgi:hypothetical protein
MDVQRIYNVLFRGRIPPELESRFTGAWQILSSDYTEEELAEFQTALEAVADLEALELVCRRCKLVPVLAAQVHLMFMLAETLPSHSSIYIHLHDEPVIGILSMAVGVVRTVWKYVRGSIELRRFYARRSYHHR